MVYEKNKYRDAINGIPTKELAPTTNQFRLDFIIK